MFLGLGARAEEGRLGPTSRAQLVETLARYAERSRQLGASSVTFIGTEPLRRAADAPQAIAEVEAASGVRLDVLSHEEEGLLTLLGVTGGRPVTDDLVVVDVGGGSSEFVVVGPKHPPVATGIKLGSARLTQRFVVADPPTGEEMAAMRTEAKSLLAGAPEAHPEAIVAVGGTASNLLRLLPWTSVDPVLTRAASPRPSRSSPRNPPRWHRSAIRSTRSGRGSCRQER